MITETSVGHGVEWLLTGLKSQVSNLGPLCTRSMVYPVPLHNGDSMMIGQGITLAVIEITIRHTDCRITR